MATQITCVHDRVYAERATKPGLLPLRPHELQMFESGAAEKCGIEWNQAPLVIGRPPDQMEGCYHSIAGAWFKTKHPKSTNHDPYHTITNEST